MRSFGSRAAAGLLAFGLVSAAAAPAGAVDEGIGKEAWWFKALKIVEAHKISTGKGVKIAVIDGPIAPNVPELKGQDVTGVKNFCGGKPTATGGAASHGTGMVVKIVGNGRGTGPGGVGVAGIAPDATVLTYANGDAVDGAEITCGSSDANEAFAKALDAAVAAGARIVTTSSGSNSVNGELILAVQRAQQAGVVVVAAAGNASTFPSVIYPAAYVGVVAVAGVDRNAKPWSGNVPRGREKFVIAAPAKNVPTGGFFDGKWSSTAEATGTSESAPLVAGGLALVAAKYPKVTGNQLIQHLIRNPGGREFGLSADLGYGIMSVTKMLASDPTKWPDVNPLLAVDSAPAPSPETTAVADASPAEDLDSSAVAASSEDDGGGAPVGLLIGAGVLALVVVAGGAVWASRSRGAPRAAGGGAGSG